LVIRKFLVSKGFDINAHDLISLTSLIMYIICDYWQYSTAAYALLRGHFKIASHGLGWWIVWKALFYDDIPGFWDQLLSGRTSLHQGTLEVMYSLEHVLIKQFTIFQVQNFFVLNSFTVVLPLTNYFGEKQILFLVTEKQQ
jgi:hypothetical protein